MLYWIRLTVLATGMVLAPAAIVYAEGEYRLGTGDKIRVRVHEWRAQRGEFFEYPAFAGEFAVGPSGTVALPLVGEVPARDSTQQEVADRIATALQNRIGLVQKPIAAVEISEFRPFYVVGAVESPGAYAYRPGMTVLEAVSIAGGLFRQRDPALLRLERDAITSRGELRVLTLQIQGLEVRRARLQAEMEDQDRVNVNLPAQPDPSLLAMVREEQAILQTRRDTLRRQRESANQIVTFLRQETESLRQRIAVKLRQVESVQKELSNIRSLVERGFSITPRQLQLERMLAEYQSDELELKTAILRAEQEINRTERTIAQLIDTRRQEVTTELRSTQTEMEAAREKAQTAQRLIYETEVTARQAIPQPVPENLEPTYALVRRLGGRTVELAATEGEALRPGDVVKVHMPLPGLPRLGGAPQQQVQSAPRN